LLFVLLSLEGFEAEETCRPVFVSRPSVFVPDSAPVNDVYADDEEPPTLRVPR